MFLSKKKQIFEIISKESYEIIDTFFKIIFFQWLKSKIILAKGRISIAQISSSNVCLGDILSQKMSLEFFKFYLNL